MSGDPGLTGLLAALSRGPDGPAAQLVAEILTELAALRAKVETLRALH